MLTRMGRARGYRDRPSLLHPRDDTFPARQGGGLWCFQLIPVGAAFAIPLDRNYIGTAAPPQIRCDDNSSAVLPGVDEMLKIRNRPWVFQVLNRAIDPAQELPPVIYQQVRGRGQPSLRMMHHPFCLMNLPFDV